MSEKHYEKKGRWMNLWKPVKCLTLELEDLVAMMMLKKNLVKGNLGVAIVGIGKMMDLMVLAGMAMQIVRELG